MDPGLFRGVDAGSWLVFLAPIVGTLVIVALGLAGTRWDDWLDERWGRGEIRDWWLLGRRRNGNGETPA